MTNPNKNCLMGMRCPNPNCPAPYGPFEIEITTSLAVYDDGTGEQLGDTEWENDSFAMCMECRRQTTVGELHAAHDRFEKD